MYIFINHTHTHTHTYIYRKQTKTKRNGKKQKQKPEVFEKVTFVVSIGYEGLSPHQWCRACGYNVLIDWICCTNTKTIPIKLFYFVKCPIV